MVHRVDRQPRALPDEAAWGSHGHARQPFRLCSQGQLVQAGCFLTPALPAAPCPLASWTLLALAVLETN